MNRSSPPPDPLHAADAAFTRYFRAQLPARFPDAPIPVDAAPKLPARSGSWRTRLTLAASVAALLAFGFTFSYGPGASQSEKKNNLVNDPNTVADGDKLKKHMKDEPIKLMP